MPVAPLRPKSPPLNALRAFEAAARLGSFVAAADELGVSPGAVSQHIKTLEAWVGARLFARRSQGVELTELGRAVVTDFSQAFDAMAGAVRQLRACAGTNRVSIAALPAVADLWLSPRLQALRAAVPDAEISITALEACPDLSRDLFDLAIFLDTPTGHGCETVLADDALLPVIAPTRRGERLADMPWLFDATWSTDWRTWCAVHAPDIALKSGAMFSLFSIAMREAEAGAGALMAHRVLVHDRLEAGTLIAPFDALQTQTSLTLRRANPIGPCAEEVACWLETSA